MARKQFLRDIEFAVHNPPAQVVKIEKYDGDGICFKYWYMHGSSRLEINLKLIALNLEDYPDGNQFILFTDDSDVDTIITNAFVKLQAVIDGSSVSAALREISGGLHQIITLGLSDDPRGLHASSQVLAHSDTDDFELEDEDDDDTSFGLDDIVSARPSIHTSETAVVAVNDQDIEAMKTDLRTARKAGFKIGVHGDLSKAGIICVSIRVTKLGISEEAIQAWSLQRNQYLVLLIRFQRGYRFLRQVVEEASLTGSVEMRVGLSDTYKPKSNEAFAAFNQIEKGAVDQTVSQPPKPANLPATGILKPLFIGRPINDLLRSRFTKIVKFRHHFGLSWCGAEHLFKDRQGTIQSDLSKDVDSYKTMDDTATRHALPSIVMQDSLAEHDIYHASLPLVAVQFVLRHFVRCTEFCLVCHCRVEDTFEALKPYVCSNPLCLYQFLALGFGPSAEWEILSQPCVVDLLVSLCYQQAQAARIKQFPVGINLRVPVLPHFQKFQTPIFSYRFQASTVGAIEPIPSLKPTMAFKASFNSEQKCLSPISDSWTNGKVTMMVGDWIVLVSSSDSSLGLHYCRISGEQDLKFNLDPVIYSTVVGNPSVKTGKQSTNGTKFDVDCYLYNNNFDDLPDHYRHPAIISLLDTLPPVSSMRTDLSQQQSEHRDPSLNSLRQRCPQAALDLLRWIVTSNRSCIMQVDRLTTTNEADQKLGHLEERVSAMDEWIQFRFAQGAPDKEQRFVDCVKTQSANIRHPTLFAWHGSPLYNWHSIIRQGLHFDEILNGRANGNGVYMSSYVQTSIGYSASQMFLDWPNSNLKMTNIVSLQEVVNAPASFVSCNPHFVVAQKDWIQTRYLFVKSSLRPSKGLATKNFYQQDPSYPARGSNNEPVVIPVTAVSRSRRSTVEPSGLPTAKKRKVATSEPRAVADSEDDVSVATDEEDVKLLDIQKERCDGFDFDDVVMTYTDDDLEDVTTRSRRRGLSDNGRKRSHESNVSFILDSSKTDFVPGTLDTTGIRFLDPPEHASISANKALMRAFNETIKAQETTPLHVLGFYIDPNRMENMYQWIVEFHSFDETLPLAKDMKEAGVTSIVFEMQFTNDFPFSPPFIRVVKPRFLDPMMGGGGHITNGGAICMELLTSTGWSAVNTIESVLFQVRLAISERERPARLMKGKGGFQSAPYPIGEAVAAYMRFCSKHGWIPPKGLDNLRAM